MSHTLVELGEQATPPPFRELVFAPYNNRKGRLLKSSLTSFALFAIRVLPRRPAMHLTRYLLVGRRQRRRLSQKFTIYTVSGTGFQ